MFQTTNQKSDNNVVSTLIETMVSGLCFMGGCNIFDLHRGHLRGCGSRLIKEDLQVELFSKLDWLIYG